MKMGMIATAAAAVMVSAANAEDAGGRISNLGAAPTFAGDGWEFKIGGRVQLDYSIIDTDISGATWSAGELRRLRLNVSGKFGDTIKYKIELHADSSGDVILEDGYAQWAPTRGAWNVKLGQFNTPNSLDELTSSRFSSVLERAAFTDAFEFNRRLGVSLNVSGDNYTLSAGLFGDNVNVSNQQAGYALAARATFNPVKNDDTVIHLGASVRYRNIGNAQDDLRYLQRPLSHISGRIISTGMIADSDLFVGAEAAAIFQNLWVAGEYGVTFASCSVAAACANDPTFDGAYAEAGLIFGGKKGYKEGRYTRPQVNNPVTRGGMGALTLVARFDTIDLTDSGVNGGSLNTYVVGADWWATKYTRLGVNLFKANANLGSTISGLDTSFAALVTAGARREDVTGVMLRAQVDF